MVHFTLIFACKSIFACNKLLLYHYLHDTTKADSKSLQLPTYSNSSSFHQKQIMMSYHMAAVRSPASEEGPPRSNKASRKPSPQRPKAQFPTKLYAMLQLADNVPEFSKAVTWLPHGRAFSVLNTDAFMNEVVPVFFNQTKMRSFNRQLHLWGFRR